MRLLLCLLALAACQGPKVTSAGSGGRDGAPGFGFDPTDAGAAERSGPGGAGGQSCAYQSFAAERLPLDLVVLVDASGSMADPVAGAGQTKWQMAQEALSSFV